MKQFLFPLIFVVGCTATNKVQSTTSPTDGEPQTLQVKNAEGFTYTQRGGSGQQGLMNRSVRIFFRRDALGYAGPVPLDPVLESTGGRSLTIEGTVRSVEPDWITIEGKNGLIQVIRGDSVLLIEVKP